MGCEKHYNVTTNLAGETIYGIERACKRDYLCVSEYDNCHDVHVSFSQPIGNELTPFYFRTARTKSEQHVIAAALATFVMMGCKHILAQFQ